MKTFSDYLDCISYKNKRLVEQFGGRILTATDIFDFYFLCTASSYEQIRPEDRNLVEFYLREIKDVYLSSFQEILMKQLEKYHARGRLDKIGSKPAFDPYALRSAPNKFELIKQMMAQTYRSDMKRRNEVWDAIADHLWKLSGVSNTDKMCYYIDRINNSVHNTGTLVLEKLRNGRQILQALDMVHHSRTPKDYVRSVSPEVRRLMKIWTGPGQEVQTQKIA